MSDDEWEAPHAPYTHEGQHALLRQLRGPSLTLALVTHLQHAHGVDPLELDLTMPVVELQDLHAELS